MSGFYVQRRVEAELAEEVSNGSWVEVVGPQRIGKTMMGQRLVAEAKAQGRLAGYCDMDRAFRYSSDEELPEEVANVLAAALGLEAPHVPKPSTPPPVSGADVEESAEKPELLSSRLKKVLAALAEQSVDGSPMLLVLDELGKLRIAFRDAFVSTLLELGPSRCQLVVLGNEEAQDYSAAFGKKLKTLWPPDFSKDQALDAVSFELNDAPSSEPSWDDAETERKVSAGIYEWVGGHAQLTRYWARKARAQGKAAYADETRASTLAGLAEADVGSRLFVRAAAWLESLREVDEIDTQLVYWQLLHAEPVAYDEGLRSHRHLRQAGFAAVDGDFSLRLRSRIFAKALNAEWVKTRLQKRSLPDVLLEGDRLLTWLKHGRESAGLPTLAAGKRITEWAEQASASALLGVEAVRAFVDACRGRQRRRKFLGIGLPLMVVLVGLGWLVVQNAIDTQRAEETQIVASELHDRAEELMRFAQDFRDEESNDAKRQFFENTEEVTRRLLEEIATTNTGIDNVLRALGEDTAGSVVEYPQRFIVAEQLARETVSDRDQAQEFLTAAQNARGAARVVVDQVLVTLGHDGSGSRQQRFHDAVSLAASIVAERNTAQRGLLIRTAERDAARSRLETCTFELAIAHSATGSAALASELTAELATRTTERNTARSTLATRTTELATRTTERNTARSTLATRTTELATRTTELATRTTELATRTTELATRTSERNAAHSRLATCRSDLAECADGLR